MHPKLRPLAERALDLTSVLARFIRMHGENFSEPMMHWDRPHIICGQIRNLLPYVGYTKEDQDGSITGMRGTLYREGSKPDYDVSIDQAVDDTDHDKLIERILVLSALQCSFVCWHGKNNVLAMHRNSRSYALAGQIETLLKRAGYRETEEAHLPGTLTRPGHRIDTSPFTDEEIIREFNGQHETSEA